MEKTIFLLDSIHQPTYPWFQPWPVPVAPSDRRERETASAVVDLRLPRRRAGRRPKKNLLRNTLLRALLYSNSSGILVIYGERDTYVRFANERLKLMRETVPENGGRVARTR